MLEIPFACVDFLNEGRARGLQIPDDLSIVSLTDWEGFLAMRPAVTAMHRANRDMSLEAGRLILDVIENGYPPEEKKLCVDYHMVQRDSVTQAPEKKAAPAGV